MVRLLQVASYCGPSVPKRYGGRHELPENLVQSILKGTHWCCGGLEQAKLVDGLARFINLSV